MPTSEQPARMTLTDLQSVAEADQHASASPTSIKAKQTANKMRSAATLEVMFNPRALSRKLAANYARKEVLGNTHAEHEYLSTGNQGISFDLFYNVETVDHLQQSIDAMNWLESLVYAPENPEAIAQAAPPRVLIVWPNTMTMTTRLMSVEFNHQRFNRHGYTIQWTAKCMWEETRIRRLNKADVRAFGALRTPESVLADADASGELLDVQFGGDDEGVSFNSEGDTLIDFGDEGLSVFGGDDPEEP